jgi:alginate O-acetyltransferase complex protein AlgI
MLFNSYEFIFIFLPLVTLVYFYLTKKRLLVGSKVWLVISSLFFYSWWNIIYLPLILGSILFNYLTGQLLLSDRWKSVHKIIITLGIIGNIGLLGYFKYADFFIANINLFTDSTFSLLNIALPLAISFFTFQQIAYLVDSFKNETREFGFINYLLFVTFFPQLIAGPIVHHHEIIPQFQNLRNKIINYKNLTLGIFVFSIGLFKKVILADTFAVWATQGFDQLETLSLIEAWIVSLSYTFQLYFDFSGYMDMAIGAALILNIHLPINFNSPYKAQNIQDCWNRWHITLGRFLYRYIYFPLNKYLLRKVFTPIGWKHKVNPRTNICLFVLFLISGIWHGAGWTFIFWGVLHGVATIVHRYWKMTKIKMNKILGWMITFNFINFTMIFFRAENFDDAFKVLKGMLGFNGILLPTNIFETFPKLESNLITFSDLPLVDTKLAVAYLVAAFVIILFLKNTHELIKNFQPNFYTLIFTFISLLYSIMNLTKESEFLYFNF